MEEWLGKNCFLPLQEWNQFAGKSCHLPREGVQLLGENCFLPWEEGDLIKSTVVDESLSSFKPMYCSREYQASTRLSQQYEKSTPNDVQGVRV